MAKQAVELHVVSDSTGETATRLVHALEAQFPDQPFEEVRHPRVETPADLDQAVQRARGRPAVVVYTLVAPELRDEMRRLCRRARLHYCDLLGHPIEAVAKVSGMAAKMEPGSRHALDESYFKRMEAIEFAVKYDDGMGSGLHDADVVLVGVSRTSKTPLSMYLGYLGWKAANIPIVKGIEPPPDLFEIEQTKIVGLTIDATAPGGDPDRPRPQDGRQQQALREAARDLRGARAGGGDPPAARVPGHRHDGAVDRGDGRSRHPTRRAAARRDGRRRPDYQVSKVFQPGLKAAPGSCGAHHV